MRKESTLAINPPTHQTYLPTFIHSTSVSRSNGCATATATAAAAAPIAIPSSKSSPPGQPPQANGSKLKGPVNGDECYFWRTTGCAFGESCKHKHIPRNKGIDRKPWQK